MKRIVRVVGGGLAGCEAALRLADFGYDVELWDIKPHAFTPAHHSAKFGELVCSNSLKSNVANTAAWLLKEEMRLLGSHLLPIADATRVAAGGALAVDRELFADGVTEAVRSNSRIRVVEMEYTEIVADVPTIIATGPLTTQSLTDTMCRIIGGNSLYFFDAAAPIVDAATVDASRCFAASRYGQGDGEYLNCPLSETEYYAFVDALVHAEGVVLKDFEGTEVFEGCMPIEVMARRGADTLRFGPLKPTGLTDAYACVQLRSENANGTSYNLVGFQTNLRIPEQKRVFRMIPALANAEFFRFGVMHRNTFLNCPIALDKSMRLKGHDSVFVAGQLSGVEGYVESMASGLLCAVYMDGLLRDGEIERLPRDTMLGALMSAISIPVGNFQPINANFGILPPLAQRVKDRTKKYELVCERALGRMRAYCDKVFQ